MTGEKWKATTIGVPELFRLFPDEDSCCWLGQVRWKDKLV